MFDLDGTLIDLRRVYLRAQQMAAAEVLGLELDDTRVLGLMGRGLPIRAHMALLSEDSADELVGAFVGTYRALRADLARPFPGVVRLLRRLQQCNVPIAVVTSKLRDDARHELAATRLEQFVDVLVAFEDASAHKPDPEPHLADRQQLGVGDGVAVGDLPTDMESARDAGLYAVGVTWGYGERRALMAAGAAIVCDTPAEVEAELEARVCQPGTI